MSLVRLPDHIPDTVTPNGHCAPEHACCAEAGQLQQRIAFLSNELNQRTRRQRLQRQLMAKVPGNAYVYGVALFEVMAGNSDFVAINQSGEMAARTGQRRDALSASLTFWTDTLPLFERHTTREYPEGEMPRSHIQLRAFNPGSFDELLEQAIATPMVEPQPKTPRLSKDRCKHHPTADVLATKHCSVCNRKVGRPRRIPTFATPEPVSEATYAF